MFMIGWRCLCKHDLPKKLGDYHVGVHHDWVVIIFRCKTCRVEVRTKVMLLVGVYDRWEVCRNSCE